MEFGKLVKLKRKQKKITLSELANDTDISISYLSRLENNERTPVITIALTLAQYLDITLEEIEDAYGIRLKERKEDNSKKDIILSDVQDYITINEINDTLIKLAQGNESFTDAIMQVSKKMELLKKDKVRITAKMGECRLIVILKFYDEKIIRYVRSFIKQVADDIIIINGGYIEETDLETETYNLMDYLDIIEYSCEPDSLELEELEEFKEYLKKINY